MKKILFICLCLTASTSYAEVDVVPLDMELGYWETTTEIVESEAIKSMLANLPESQRDQVREMMKNKTQLSVVKQCITSDFFEDSRRNLKNQWGLKRAASLRLKKARAKSLLASSAVPVIQLRYTLRPLILNDKYQMS
ncbi:MAG: DUF3617 family protein [Arenicella sp.]|nr:DUF3617 family protein [Arenicella sp.]